MGYWKEKWAEQMGRGYSPPTDRFVCPACVTDEHLAGALAVEVEDHSCSYCGAPQAADISVLLNEISDVILADYTDPANELPFESREGGYQGSVYSGSELVHNLDSWTDCDELLDDVANSFNGSAWCERDYFGMSLYKTLRYGWNGFSEQVKHHTRYLFLQELGSGDHQDPDEIPPGRMLDALGQLFREFELFSELPAGTEFIRARVVRIGERPSTAVELGTAPHEFATFANRMSPAGIPMFYAAFDEATAVLETYDPTRDEEREITLARFQNVKTLNMLDLTSLPAVPSSFDRGNRKKREPISFLWSFAADLSKPVARDDRSHTEYVPTQVVTEFVRHRLRTPSGASLDGILYRSSRAAASTAVVIFAENKQCGPRDEREHYDPEPFLELRGVRYAKPDEFEPLWVLPERHLADEMLTFTGTTE